MKKVLFFIPNLSVGGAEKVLVNLVNNMDKSKFDITVQTLFAGGVNEQFLDKHINYRYCFKKTFRGKSQILKLFSPKTLYKKFIKERYDIIVSYLEGPTARIVSERKFLLKTFSAFPSLYCLFRIATDRTMLDWEKAQKKKNK